MADAAELIHATVIARRGGGPDGGWRAVLLTGPSGAGKSDLALRLFERGWRLVADDYAHAWASGERLYARAPDAIFGRIEARGVGLLRRGALRFARAVLIARCVDQAPERLPEPAFQTVSGVRLPLIAVEALHASAPARIDAALTSLGQDRPLAY